ncbi:MAG: tRNA (adenosine(37)-N6)-threonylcarbamoyltransferase complex ATPase subunit type 1 TsaE [Candidatus Kerfeldbacteria bacterium]|nr:tRNA (adenosine(37)-N6)-threonylcarbamoyltransferase complex ATPase subunit type 1 TsaE [Candidatus Kerfeldbacteria bacterium]
MRRSVVTISRSPTETRQFGAMLGRAARAGDVILISGQLGSGKTTLAQALARALGVRRPVRSPSYLVASAYPVSRRSIRTFYHLDLFRLRRLSAVDAAVISETISDRQAVVLAEWADRLPGRLVPTWRRTSVRLTVQSERRRAIRVSGRLIRSVLARPGRRSSVSSVGRARLRRRAA